MNTHTPKTSKHRPSAFQGRLNFDAVSKPRVSLAVEYPVERIILRTLVTMLVVLAACYLYFVSASVINIMARREAMDQSAQIEGSIGALEGQYFALSQSITPQAALAMGLTPIPIQNTDYVHRTGEGIADAAR